MKKQTFLKFAKALFSVVLIAIGAFSALSVFAPDLADALTALVGIGEGSVGVMTATTIMTANTRASTDAARPRSATDPGHLADDVSQLVTMIQPDDFSLDSLLREASQSEKATDWIVNFEEVELRGHSDQLNGAYVVPGGGTPAPVAFANLTVDNPSLWKKGETIEVPSVTALGSKPLLLRIDSINSNNTLRVTAINTTDNLLPAIADNAVLYRGATAHGERVAKAQNKSLVPANRFNYCQRHLAQVDEGYIRSMLDTKSGFSKKDQNYMAMYDFRTEIAKTSYFGQKYIVPSEEEDEDVYYAEGVYHQLTKQLDWTTAGGITNNMWIDWCNTIFADNNGASDRYVFAGRNTIAAISKIPDVQKQLEGGSTEVVAGVKLKKIETLFGELYIKHDKIFDITGHTDDGVVLDLTQIRKRPFMALTSRELKLREAGIENTNATLIEEIMCLETRYLSTHARIKRTA